MFCSKCGNELNEEAIFCPKCGNKVNVVHSEENIKENTFANTVDNELNDTSVENTENVSVTNDKEESIVEENFCSERKPEFVNPKSNTDSFEKVTLDESEKKSEGDDTESFKDLFRGLLDSLENEDYLFFKDLKHRAKIQLISLVLSKVLLGLGAIAGIVYIIQETRAGEGYKLGFYIIGFLIAIMPYMIPSGLFDCVTEILDFQKDSIKKEYDPKLYLGLYVFSGILGLLACLPFLNPSDADLAEWMLYIGFGGILDVMECFSFQIILAILAGLVSIVSSRIMLYDKEN